MFGIFSARAATRLRRAAAAALALLAAGGAARAETGRSENAPPQEPRLALIVANQGYGPAVGPLDNPHNDAAVMRAALERHGFEARVLLDAGRGETLAAVSRFAAALDDAGPRAVGFFYYSGHGAARPNTARNYLIPVTVRDSATEAFWFDSVPLEEIRRMLREEAPKAAHIVVFDACRNELNLGRRGGKGFAAAPSSPGGMMTAFSAEPGQMASDGAPGAAGPYARALAGQLDAALARPGGVAVETVFKNVRLAMLADSQAPIYSDGLDRPIVFGDPAAAPRVSAVAPAPPPAASSPQAPPAAAADEGGAADLADEGAAAAAQTAAAEDAAAEETSWAALSGTRDVAAYDAFLRAHPGGARADAARRARAALIAEQRAAQVELARLGHPVGRPDGVWGPKSRAALAGFLAARGAPPARRLEPPHLAMLRAAPTPPAPAPPPAARAPDAPPPEPAPAAAAPERLEMAARVSYAFDGGPLRACEGVARGRGRPFAVQGLFFECDGVRFTLSLTVADDGRASGSLRVKDFRPRQGVPMVNESLPPEMFYKYSLRGPRPDALRAERTTRIRTDGAYAGAKLRELSALSVRAALR